MVHYVYKVDPKNRSVDCMGIVRDNDGHFLSFHVGRAKCHTDDEFDVNYGMKLAYLRCRMNIIKNSLNHRKHQVTKLNKKVKYLEKCADEAAEFVTVEKHYLEEVDEQIKKLLEEKK